VRNTSKRVCHEVGQEKKMKSSSVRVEPAELKLVVSSTTATKLVFDHWAVT